MNARSQLRMLINTPCNHGAQAVCPRDAAKAALAELDSEYRTGYEQGKADGLAESDKWHSAIFFPRKVEGE